MGDLVAPSSEQLRFGNFDVMELREVSCIAINVNPQTIINEYGSNFMKYKQDPLVTIEAKNALHGSNKDDIFQFGDIIGKSGSAKSLPTIVEEKEKEIVGRATSFSPVKGSQGGPEVDFSSQEEVHQKESQDIDWEVIQAEDG
jgi:hypothetical protein